MTVPAPGSVWVDCDPRSSVRVRVVSVSGPRAVVVDADSGKLLRRVLISSFHPTPTTRTGRMRRTGYVPDRSIVSQAIKEQQ